MNRCKRLWSGLAFALPLAAATCVVSAPASAQLRRFGSWPDDGPQVSLDLSDVTRAEALRALAREAHWSLVTQLPTGKTVDLHVSEQPAAKVLEMLLADGEYVARRDGALVSIEQPAGRDPAAIAPPAAGDPRPPAPPEPHGGATPRGEDRTVTGGSLHIGRDEVVHNVAVYGGSLDVQGTVTGDVAVLGGSVRLRRGARVLGSATTLGGSLRVEDGASVEGDVGVVGGRLHRDEGARIGGSVVNEDSGSDRRRRGRGPSPEPNEPEARDPQDAAAPSLLARLGRGLASSLRTMSLFFVFGTVLQALFTARLETLRAEAAARPMRSFALGLVSLLASVLLIAALSLTVIGIPLAVMSAVMLAIGAYGGMCAVLSTAGCALCGHRTENPYVHLGAGCALFVILGALPYVGPVVEAAVLLAGIGTLVATRGAGLVGHRTSADTRRT